MLERLARWCYRRRWVVLVAWIVALIGLGGVGNRFAGETADNFELPASESQQVFELLEQKFGGFADDGARIVMQADDGFYNAAIRRQVGALLADVRKAPVVVGVSSPYQIGRGAISPNGKVAFASIQLNVRGPDIDREEVLDLKRRVDDASTDGLKTYLGGQVARFVEQQNSFGQEWIGLLAAIVILLLTFGSVIAMGLPLMTAIFGLGIGLSLLGLMAHIVDIPQFAPSLAIMIGLGVGIDYSLFIVTRYRQTLHGGAEPEEAVVTAVTTSGRAVLFAGTTVVISLLGLFMIGLKFVQGMAIGASLTVAVVTTASVTLLPAVLGFAGHAIDRLRVPGLHRDESDHRSSVWYRWSRIIQRRPVPAAIAGTAVLVAFALPLFSIELGFTDEGNDPPGTSTREAYDLLAEGFGPGFNGPLLLVAELPQPDDLAAFNRAIAGMQDEPGVAAVRAAFPNRDRTAALAAVFPTTSPQSDETRQLIHRLRNEVVPAAISEGAPHILVGGITSLFADFSDYLQGRIPYFIGAVLILSFLLLMVVFRSLVIPLKAGLVNMLGIGAAYGVVVAIFQWGWLKDVIGVQRTGPIEAFLPMMLFAILFGLSMDYEVFLMSRIREEYLRTKRNDIAVADGLAATAGVITAAAAIMVTLFFSFVLGDDRVIKLFGMGLAVAIFLDATIIRMVVVPAFMELFGDANWWVPRWLDRILPRISIDVAPERIEVGPMPVEVPVEISDGKAQLDGAKAKPKAPARTGTKAAAKSKTPSRAKAKAPSRASAKATPKAKPKSPARAKAKAARPRTSSATGRAPEPPPGGDG
jgi:putative drug exporter of the RND superfamily